MNRATSDCPFLGAGDGEGARSRFFWQGSSVFASKIEDAAGIAGSQPEEKASSP